jgi:hypothetical protein
MNGIHEVTGSIPVWSTNLRFAQSADGDRAQSRGCPFESASGSDPGLVQHPLARRVSTSYLRQREAETHTDHLVVGRPLVRFGAFFGGSRQ